MSEDFNQFNDKSALQMLREVGRLLLVLLARLLLALLRLLRRLGKGLLRLLCKGLLFCIDFTHHTVVRLRDFWNDNDTQEKLHKLHLRLRWLGLLTLKGLRISAKATWWGVRWLSKKIGVGLVAFAHAMLYALLHIGPTLRFLGHGARQVLKTLGRCLHRCARGLRKVYRRHQRAWRHFRRNKGFKGLLIDFGVWLKCQINNYIEEQSEDSSSDNENATAEELDEDAAESQRLLEQSDNEDDYSFKPNADGKRKIPTFGRSIYNAMKRIVEDE